MYKFVAFFKLIGFAEWGDEWQFQNNSIVTNNLCVIGMIKIN